MKIIPEKIDIINDIEPNEAVSKIIFSVVSKGANSAFSDESFLFRNLWSWIRAKIAMIDPAQSIAYAKTEVKICVFICQVIGLISDWRLSNPEISEVNNKAETEEISKIPAENPHISFLSEANMAMNANWKPMSEIILAIEKCNPFFCTTLSNKTIPWTVIPRRPKINPMENKTFWYLLYDGHWDDAYVNEDIM